MSFAEIKKELKKQEIVMESSNIGTEGFMNINLPTGIYLVKVNKTSQRMQQRIIAMD
jgi:hypothetical protein